MIKGNVTDECEALIELKAVARDGTEFNIKALVDTGFNGYLTLPPPMIARLGLLNGRPSPVMLGDGRTVALNRFAGMVLFGETRVRSMILEAEGQAIVGMSRLAGHHLIIEVREGGAGSLKPLEGGREFEHERI